MGFTAALRTEPLMTAGFRVDFLALLAELSVGDGTRLSVGVLSEATGEASLAAAAVFLTVWRVRTICGSAGVLVGYWEDAGS